MALQKTIDLGIGVDLSYWKIVLQQDSFHKDEHVVHLGGWVDEAARTANPNNPVHTLDFCNSPHHNLIIDTSALDHVVNNTEKAYLAIKATDKMEGAIDV